MKAINFLFFLIFLGLGEAAAFFVAMFSPPLGGLVGILAFFFAIFMASLIKLAYEWEKAVILRLGKYKTVKGPGLFLVIPVVDHALFIDTRLMTVDIPQQQAITKDNVPVTVDGVIFFKVLSPNKAILEIQNYKFAMREFALASLRDLIGELSLDELLSERDQIGHKLEKLVEQNATNWGLHVTTIKLQDINMPEDLKKMMSRQASAEREKRANITKAEGDRDAAINLAKASEVMATSPGAMQLRTLQTIDGLGPTASNTVVLAIPIEVMDALRALGHNPVIVKQEDAKA